MFCTVVLGIYLKRNILVTDEKHLSQKTVNKVCSNTERLNRIPKNGMLKEESKGKWKGTNKEGKESDTAPFSNSTGYVCRVKICFVLWSIKIRNMAAQNLQLNAVRSG